MFIPKHGVIYCSNACLKQKSTLNQNKALTNPPIINSPFGSPSMNKSRNNNDQFIVQKSGSPATIHRNTNKLLNPCILPINNQSPSRSLGSTSSSISNSSGGNPVTLQIVNKSIGSNAVLNASVNNNNNSNPRFNQSNHMKQNSEGGTGLDDQLINSTLINQSSRSRKPFNLAEYESSLATATANTTNLVVASNQKYPPQQQQQQQSYANTNNVNNSFDDLDAVEVVNLNQINAARQRHSMANPQVKHGQQQMRQFEQQNLQVY